MKIEDDRTPNQRKTHTHLIVGTDTFMGGFGKAAGGVSYAAWACLPEHALEQMRHVEDRTDMLRVRNVYDPPENPYRPSARGHLHIYVVDEPRSFFC